MGGVHHVVARFEGEGDLRDIHRHPRRAAGSPRALGVRGAHKREVRLGNDHAEGNVHIHDVHHAPAQAALGLGGGVGVCGICARDAPPDRRRTITIVEVLRLQNLDGDAVVHEGVAHGLARAVVRRGEHHGVAILGQALQLPEDLVGHAGHVHTLHRQLVVKFAAHAHDGHIGGTHGPAEVHGRRARVQARKRDVRAPGALGQVVGAVGRIVEERARLDERAERARARIGPERHRVLVQVGQNHVGALEHEAALHLLEHLAQSRVRERRLLQGAPGVGQSARRRGKLRDRVDLHARQRGDGLARRRHDAADFLQLVAEEVEAHREIQVAGEHVQRAAAVGEGARPVQLAGIGVAGRREGAWQIVQLLHAGNAHG